MPKKSPYPIVILHGWGLSGARYAALSERLQKDSYAVYAPDLPGFGSNKKVDEPYTLATYSLFLERFLKEKKIQKCILIGHSFGGRVALFLTAQRPNLVAALVLTGVPGFSPTAKVKTIPFLIIAKLGGVLFSFSPLSLFRKPARWLLYKLAGEKDFYQARGVMRETFQQVTRHRLFGYMEKVSCPTLLLWGESDTTTPLWIGKKMKQSIPNARLVVVAHAGHMMPADSPKQFVNHVATFLKDI